MKSLTYSAVLLLLLSVFNCSSSGSGIESTMDGEVIIDNRIISSDDSEGKDFMQLGFDLMAAESTGILKIGMKDSEIIKGIGKPEKKSKEILAGFDGKKHQSWFYPKKGIELGLVREGSYQLTDYIKIDRPCKFLTRRNIGLGSSRSEVIEAYKNEIDQGLLNDDLNTITAGSVYGGIIFNLDKTGRVTSIFIGAAAE